jgi:beta-glucosidase
MHGCYPNAFVEPTPYEQMGFRSGDETIMQVPLDWIGFHYYTRRIVSDARGSGHGADGTLATETQDTAHGGDAWTQMDAVMPTEGLLTDGGLEVWRRGIYDLVTRISREYNNPVLEITGYRAAHRPSRQRIC